MPTIVRFASSVVTMYAADHLPPHFHVRTKDGREALIVIETLAVLSGDLSRRELSAALNGPPRTRPPSSPDGRS